MLLPLEMFFKGLVAFLSSRLCLVYLCMSLTVLLLQNCFHTAGAHVCGVMEDQCDTGKGHRHVYFEPNTYSDTCQGPGQFNFPNFPFPISQINHVRGLIKIHY